MSTDIPGTLELPERLDNATAKDLSNQLQARQGQPLLLDGHKVKFVGTLGLQVLIAAARQWQAEETELTLDPISPALSGACRTLGISSTDIGAKTETEGFA